MTDKTLLALAKQERDELVRYFESLTECPKVTIGAKKFTDPKLFVDTNIERIKSNMYPSKVFNSSMKGLKEYKLAIQKI